MQRPRFPLTDEPEGLANHALPPSNGTASLSSRYALGLVIALGALTAFPARAAITFGNVQQASNVELGETTPALIIYGGVAGEPATTPDPNSTYNTCVNPQTPGAVACNDRRIHPNLRLVIPFTSDKTGGRPFLIAEPTSGSATTIAVETGSSTTVNQGAEGTLIVTWANICSNMGAGIDQTCIPTDSTKASKATFKVGVDNDNDGSIDGANDDSTSIQIVVSSGIGQTPAGHVGVSTVRGCDDATAIGMCHYEVAPGDGKVFLKNLVGLNNFPTNAPLNFARLRVFFAEGNLSNFNTIQSDSPFVDVGVSGTEGGAISVSPGRIDGLQNDVEYVFRVAVVDQAGNVGYYTDDTAKTYCEHAVKQNNGDCHVATPGEVVGVLAANPNCFIATAAFGSTMSPQVETFRQFRDHRLLNSEWGARFVDFYYEHSPRFAHAIAQSEALRAASRMLLWPLLGFAWLSLKAGTSTAALLAATLLLLPLLMIRRESRRKAPHGSSRL